MGDFIKTLVDSGCPFLSFAVTLVDSSALSYPCPPEHVSVVTNDGKIIVVRE
jgi:hypothetical protein